MIKYANICHNCAGLMKEISRKDAGDFIKVTFQCEDCGVTEVASIIKPKKEKKQ